MATASTRCPAAYYTVPHGCSRYTCSSRRYVDMVGAQSLRRTAFVARKEVLHALRDPMTLFIAMIMPILQLLMIGYAVNTNIRNIATVVFDHARTQESRNLVFRFINSDSFTVIG